MGNKNGSGKGDKASTGKDINKEFLAVVLTPIATPSRE